MVRLLLVCGMMVGFYVPPASAQTAQALFEFTDQHDASRWQIVNDGVMGGRSSSQATITGEGQMRFSGNLSLENNGGFASVRSLPQSMGLDAGETIVMRVKGDGRKYTFNLYTPDRRTAFSYQKDFQTTAGEWTEVRLPVNEFVAHSFGRRVANMPLDATRVQSIGILLGDKNPGGFEILVDWIRVE
ncbi:Complex I intermediate-associated protein 30 (CIA30) [Rubripirellula tenax]|uniref:Complex I intermediate-associated protein 30 (CIA30) n=1 Tax=Rubripirellula tenax TaxID=2528015 RepID=A0A5C6F8K2_9BACT|nr:CIA30 family protein [Rubripirellula tenax]TWU56814.1 Complex I intermediate-associated protein 30 (CIA30) [Rubripirellula tenax]